MLLVVEFLYEISWKLASWFESWKRGHTNSRVISYDYFVGSVTILQVVNWNCSPPTCLSVWWQKTTKEPLERFSWNVLSKSVQSLRFLFGSDVSMAPHVSWVQLATSKHFCKHLTYNFETILWTEKHSAWHCTEEWHTLFMGHTFLT